MDESGLLPEEGDEPSCIGEVDVPVGTVGVQAAASTSTGGSNLKDFSIANWRTEVKNRVAQWRQSKTDIGTLMVTFFTSQIKCMSINC